MEYSGSLEWDKALVSCIGLSAYVYLHEYRFPLFDPLAHAGS